MDTTPHLVDAVNLVRRARAEGRGIHDLANQNDILSGQVEPSVTQFLRVFFGGDRLTRPHGRKTISEDLSTYVSLARSTLPGDDLFVDAAPPGEPVLDQITYRCRTHDNNAQQARNTQ